MITVKNLCDSNQSDINTLKPSKISKSPEDRRTKKTTVKAGRTFSRIVRYKKAEEPRKNKEKKKCVKGKKTYASNLKSPQISRNKHTDPLSRNTGYNGKILICSWSAPSDVGVVPDDGQKLHPRRLYGGFVFLKIHSVSQVALEALKF